MLNTASSDRRNFGFDSHQFMLELLYDTVMEPSLDVIADYNGWQSTASGQTDFEEWRDFYVNDRELKDYDDALYWTEWFDWEKEIFGGSHHFWLYRGWCMVELGRSDDALLDLQRYRSIESDPILRSSASLGLARIYLSEGKVTRALEELGFILNAAPDDPFTREQVGKILLDHWMTVVDRLLAGGKYREEFKQLELIPGPGQAAMSPHLSWIYLACCEQGLDSLKEALKCLRKYISGESDQCLRAYASICLALTYWLEMKNAMVFAGPGFLTIDIAAYIDLSMNRSLASARNYLSSGRMIEARAEIEFIRANLPLDRFDLLAEAESLFMEYWKNEYDQLHDLVHHSHSDKYFWEVPGLSMPGERTLPEYGTRDPLPCVFSPGLEVF